MKITLIFPPMLTAISQMDVITPPMGVAYLASFMMKEGVDVQLIDAQGEEPDGNYPFKKGTTIRGLSFDKILERIDPKTSLIGISSLFTVGFPVVVDLSLRIKEEFPEIPIILGGNHPTYMPEESLKDSNADFVILGEGEYPLARFCEYLDEKCSLEDIDGIAYYKGNNFVKQPSKRILNLNEESVPFPARQLLPQENYMDTESGWSGSTKRWTPLFTSRGCPFTCSFCSSRLSKFVARSAIDVVNEMEECFEKYGIEDFHIEDDNLTLQKPRIIDICNEIIKRKLKIQWQTPNGIRASAVTLDLLDKMKESGCVSIVLAPESGSSRVLKDIALKGKVDHKHIIDLTRKAHKIGLKTSAFFVMGFPGEKVEDIHMSIDYGCELVKAGLDEAVFNLFVPLPGTPLWPVVEKKFNDGKVDYLEFLAQTNLDSAISWSEHINDKELHSLRALAYRKLLIYRAIYHPFVLIKSLLNVIRGIAETKAESHLRTMLKKHAKDKHSKDLNIKLNPIRVIYVIIFNILPNFIFSRNK